MYELNIYVSKTSNFYKNIIDNLIFNKKINIKINYITNFYDFDKINLIIKTISNYEKNTLTILKKKKIFINTFVLYQLLGSKNIFTDFKYNFYPYTFFIDKKINYLLIKDNINQYKNDIENNSYSNKTNLFGNKWWIIKKNLSQQGKDIKIVSEK